MTGTIEFRNEESLSAFLLAFLESGNTAIFEVRETATGYVLTFTGGH